MQCNNDAKLLWFNKVTNNKLQKCVHCTKIKVWFYFIKSPGVWYWFPANSIDITNWNSNLKFYFRLTAWKVSKYGVFPGPNAGKYGPEKTPYLGTFRAVNLTKNRTGTLLKTGLHCRCFFVNFLNSLRKDIFACLFSVYNTMSLSCHEQVFLET